MVCGYDRLNGMRAYVTSIVGGAYSALVALAGFWSDNSLNPSEICYALAAGLAGTGLIRVASEIAHPNNGKTPGK